MYNKKVWILSQKIIYTKLQHNHLIAISMEPFVFKNASFIKSATSGDTWIQDKISEICFLGRSNVGKSSLINALTNQKKLAKIAQKPGKTIVINFYQINQGSFRLVDVPGYGYAGLPRHVIININNFMEEYLKYRINLKLTCVLIDLRRGILPIDITMINFLTTNAIPFMFITTKSDKLSNSQRKKQLQQIKQDFPRISIVVTSAKTTTWQANLWQIFDQKIKSNDDD